MLKRLWSDYRNACLVSLALLVVGIVVTPWVLLAAVVPIGWVLLKSQTGEQDPPQERTIDKQIKSPLRSRCPNGMQKI